MSLKFDSGKVEKVVEKLKGMPEIVLISRNDILYALLDCCISEKEIQYTMLFEKMWKLYPNKRGKSAVSTKAKKELVRAGEEAIIKAIENYKRLKPEWANWLDGSTFFNGRWRDYVAPEQEAAPPKAPKKKAGNYAERVYDPEYLNSFIGGDDD